MFDWQALYDWQFTSFAGNPAVVVEVQSLQSDSTRYAVNEIERRKLDNIKFWTCTDEEAESFAANFKDGGLALVFIDGEKNYERTLACMNAFYPKVHFNSVLAGSGTGNPEVMRAVREFCAGVDLPLRAQGSIWLISHCHKPKELW